MEAWEYIIATTVMEADKERKAQKQNSKRSQNANTGEGTIPGLIIAFVIWIIMTLVFSKL